MHSLPKLKFDKDKLEPLISQNTINYHYGKHHSGYVNKLNKALEDYPDLLNKGIESLLKEVGSAPEEVRGAILNNGGQHYNHSLYWESISPNSNGKPEGDLLEAIQKKFGSFEKFRQLFTQSGATQFGSGWAWLSVSENGELEVEHTSNADTPLLRGKQPILTMDVWEHAYYLDYQNDRPGYIQHFFNIIDWTEVSRKYSAAK